MDETVATASTIRRYRTKEERRRIVEATLVSGESVSMMARRHGVNTNQLFHWRKLYQAGLLGTARCEATKKELQLLPVSVSDEPAGKPPGTGTVNIEFPGRALVSIEGQADPSIVRAVLESLRG